jgi:hypothetical protein
MARGWVVKYKDGTVVPEWIFQRPFSQLPDIGEIDTVALVFEDRHWVLPKDKKFYFSQKGESVLFGTSGMIGGRRIETRTLGYWEGDRKIKYTLNELTGEMYGPYDDGR